MRYSNSSFSVRRRHSIELKKKKELSHLLRNAEYSHWQWYDPPENSAPVHFFMDTSLHGLRYLGQQKRHICERIFWLIAFIAAGICSGILIYHMWNSYKNMPIITVFNSKVKTVDTLPFPSITVCSVNSIKQSKWDEYERKANLALRGGVSNETLLRRFATILDVSHICRSAKTFTQKFYTKPSLDDGELRTNMYNRRFEFRQFLDASGTLLNSSQSCEEMILFCLWLDTVRNCSDLFNQVVTDYGSCCTFNMIPLSLLRKYVEYNTDDPQKVKDWKEADLHSENLIIEETDKNRKYPYRQLYAGRSAGLSFMIDPNLVEYHCTNTDSDGFVVGLNVPLDFPRMRDNGLAVRPGTEVFISVRPDITISADSARRAELEKRHCYFEGEKKLTYYTKYSASNCLDECIARKTFEECQCVRYYQARINGSIVSCTPGKYSCTEAVKAKLIKAGLDKECNNCWPSCTEIKFHTEVSSLRVRKHHVMDLLKNYPNITLDEQRAKSVSIIHVSYNVESVFPRLRKERLTRIELLSDAGGLLGLCLGCSILSLLEILYYVTIRLFCRKYEERRNEVEFLQKQDSNNDINSEYQENKRTNKGIGFVSKVFGHHGTLVKDSNNQSSEASIWEIYGSGNGSSNHRPVYFHSPFEADFQRTFIATKHGGNPSHIWISY